MKAKLSIKKYFGDAAQEYDLGIDRGYFTIQNDQKIEINDIVFMEQIHTNKVQDITPIIWDELKTKKFNILPQIDAMLTNIPSIFLCVRTADCYPILIYDEVRKVIAVAHSGREGTKLRILEKILDRMKELYYCDMNDIKVHIGAGICMNHYTVSEDIADDFYIKNNSIEPKYNKLNLSPRIDILEAIVKTAIDNNILRTNIIYDTECTFESVNYFSYRRDKTNKRQISLIGMEYVR